MQPIHTLCDFFTRSGAEVTLYHLGRRVVPCARDTLLAFEQQQLAWPEPWQGQARIAVLFRLGDMPEPAIWFLALPLDEQGMLSPAPRDAFLQRLLETLGRSVLQVGKPAAADAEHLMQDNPLAFTPSLTFQALLNARATHDRALPASQHFELAQAYLDGSQTLDWQALGLQGIADVVVRLDIEASATLAQRLDALPTEVLHSLCYCLEHIDVAPRLAAALSARGEQAAREGDLETFCACLRCVGSSQAAAAGTWYDAVLEDAHACGPDTLAAIAGRGWPQLEHAERLNRFLTRLADDPRQDFAAVVRDLALIPRLRLLVMMQLRDAPANSMMARRLAMMTSTARVTPRS